MPPCAPGSRRVRAMTYELLDRPSFSVAKVTLQHGEAIRAEAGAMLAMSPTVELESKGAGGLGKMLGRMLGGESMFQTTFTATRGAGEVLLAPPAPGDIIAIPMQGSSLMVTSGCYLAGDTSLTMETQANLRGFFGGEGLFMLRVRGTGVLLLSAFGAVQRIDLQAGEAYTVDTGHLVAFSEGTGYTLRKAARGLMGTITSGEGIVADLSGPGSVWIQTRTPAGFAAWMAGLMPNRG